MSVLESVFDKVAGLQLYNKAEIPTQDFSYEYCKSFKKVLYQTLLVATFGYNASQSNFCRHEGLCPATKTKIHRCWFRWN